MSGTRHAPAARRYKAAKSRESSSYLTLEGEFELTAEGETFEGDAEAEQTDDGDWSLDLTAQGDTIELDCEIDDDTLSCDTDQDGFHYDIEWERD